jgi:hypothetical protein
MKPPGGQLTPSLCEGGTLIGEPCVTCCCFNEIIRVPQSAKALQGATSWPSGDFPPRGAIQLRLFESGSEGESEWPSEHRRELHLVGVSNRSIWARNDDRVLTTCKFVLVQV